MTYPQSLVTKKPLVVGCFSKFRSFKNAIPVQLLDNKRYDTCKFWSYKALDTITFIEKDAKDKIFKEEMI